jgi:hypothetical protein
MHAVVSRPTTLGALARGSRRAQNGRQNAKMSMIRADSTPTRVVAATRATRTQRAATILARGFSVESDVIDPIKGTIADVQSVSGIKRVVERACLYGAVGVVAFASIQAMHFGGAGLGAVMKAAHLPNAPVTVFGPVANALLMTRAGAYLQAAAAAAGALGVDYEDIAATIGSLVFVLAGVCVWGGSGLGVTDALVRNAQGYHLALGGLLALKVRRFRNWLPGAQAELIRKVAYAGPGLLMSLIIIQGISMGSFDKMGMVGPGVLGPVAALLFNPITHFVNLYASLNYLTGAETRRSSFVMALVQIVAGVSLAPQLTQPYGNALALMHLAIGLGLLRECTPSDSLIPDLS